MIVLQLHLKEIQYRCIYVGLAYLFSFVYAFETVDIYLYTLLHYVGIGETQCTYIGEAFNVSLVIAMMIAFIFTLPYGVYMVQSYTRPGKRRTPCDYACMTHLKFHRLLQQTLRLYTRKILQVCVGILVLLCILKSVPLVIQYFLSYADGLQIALVQGYEKSSHLHPMQNEMTRVHAHTYQIPAYQIHTHPRLQPTVYFTLRICLTVICMFTCFWLIMRYNQDRLSNVHTSTHTFRPYAYVLVILFASIIVPPEGYIQIFITCILFSILEVSIFMAMYNQELMHKHHA